MHTTLETSCHTFMLQYSHYIFTGANIFIPCIIQFYTFLGYESVRRQIFICNTFFRCCMANVVAQPLRWQKEALEFWWTAASLTFHSSLRVLLIEQYNICPAAACIVRLHSPQIWSCSGKCSSSHSFSKQNLCGVLFKQYADLCGKRGWDKLSLLAIVVRVTPWEPMKFDNWQYNMASHDGSHYVS